MFTSHKIIMADAPTPFIAYALKAGIVHLCVAEGESTQGRVHSLCRSDLDGCDLVRVDQDDLDKLQDFIICKGCAIRYTLLGYRNFFGRVEVRKEVILEGQLSLF